MAVRGAEHPGTADRLPPELSAEAEVLSMVSAGFQLLAELHAALDRAKGDTAQAQRHVTGATQELAAIQRMFDRRASQ